MIQSKHAFSSGGKQAAVYVSASCGAPLVVFSHFSGDGENIAEGLCALGCQCSLLVVSELDWSRDMSPWESPPAMKNDSAYTGGARAFLAALTDTIMPEAKRLIGGSPAFSAVAGYSLAGLFSLYSLYNCAEFRRAASVSGSLWFPGFYEYAVEHQFIIKPDKLYLSLGDKEARVNNPVVSLVRDKTESLVEIYRARGVDTVFELNPGNHFKDAEARCVKGIASILKT